MTKIIAHRGASHDAPENTLAAFAEAWNQAADGIEGDYCYTADRHIVCIHDDDTQRTGSFSLVVAESTLADLLAVDVGIRKGSNYQGQRIPTLQQVLRSVPDGKWCVIELKTGPEIIALLKSELEQVKLDRTRLLVIAFDQQTILESKRQLPDVRAHWLLEYTRTNDGLWSPTAAEVAEVVKACGADGIGSHANREVLTPEFLQQLKAGGVNEFHLWTVDDPEAAKYFCSQGAWGITTNRPAWIREQLGDTALKI